MRRYTFNENLLSVLIGTAIGLSILPWVALNRAKAEPIIIKEPAPVYIDIERPAKQEKIIIIQTEEIPTVDETMETEESTEVETEEVEPYFPYTQEDIYKVGNVAFYEEGILLYRVSYEDAIKAIQMASSCLVNRAKMNYKRYGRTIDSQLKSSQYECLKYNDVYGKKEEVPELFYTIAEDIMMYGPVISERLVFQSQFTQGEPVCEPIYNQHFGLLPESEYHAYNNSH